MKEFLINCKDSICFYYNCLRNAKKNQEIIFQVKEVSECQKITIEHLKILKADSYTLKLAQRFNTDLDHALDRKFLGE